MKSPPALRLIASLVLFHCWGCTDNPAAPIPTQSAKPLAVEFQHRQARIIGERYLVIPQQVKSSKEFVYQKLMISGSAWSGFGSGPGYGQNLNLTIVNLANGHRVNVFDRQVALGDWCKSFRSGCSQYDSCDSIADGDLRYPNQLILTARADDTNKDKQIDERDSAAVYLYDLAGCRLQCITPTGYSVEDLDFAADRLILSLTREPARLETAIYAYDPKADTGSFVTQPFSP